MLAKSILLKTAEAENKTISPIMKNRSSILLKPSGGTVSNIETDTDYNKGGIGGGVKQVAGKFGTGIIGVGEGIWDFCAGGIASLFGNEDYAKRLMEDNIAGRMNEQLDTEYNPSKGMQFAGDVASGIGQSTVGLAVSAGIGALVFVSGGTLAPAAEIGRAHV